MPYNHIAAATTLNSPQADSGSFTGLLSSPLTQGLLAAGLGAMASRGSTMQALGRGGLLGLSQFGQAAGAQNNRLMEMAKERMQQQVLGNVDAGGTPTASELSAAGFDPKEWANVMRGGRPELQAVNRGGSTLMVNPYDASTTAEFANTPSIENMMANANNLVSLGSNGQPQMNQALWNTQQMSADADLRRDVQRSAAQASIDAQSDLVSMPDGRGGQQLMPRSQAMAFLGGGQPQAVQPMPGMAEPAQMQRQGQLGYTPPPDTTKEDYEFAKTIRKDVAGGQRTLNLVDRNIAYLDRLLSNEAGIRGITGRAAQFRPTLVMLDRELEANADIDTIMSKVVQQTMDEMRQASSSGATGFGNMNKEQLKVLQDSMGSLSRAQTGDQIMENLRVIRNAFESIRNDALGDLNSTVEQYGSVLGGRFQTGQFGQPRKVVSPASITGERNGGQQRPDLEQIFGF